MHYWARGWGNVGCGGRGGSQVQHKRPLYQQEVLQPLVKKKTLEDMAHVGHTVLGCHPNRA